MPIEEQGQVSASSVRARDPGGDKLAVEYRDLDTLIPYINNARTHNRNQVQQIAASIKEFGWTNPVLVDGDNGIIAGHGRVQAARVLKMEQVPVIELNGLTDVQRRAYILADNRLALNAGWDEEILGIELQGLDDVDFDLSTLGFELEELSSYLDPPPGLTEPDDVPDLPGESVSHLGDLWILDNHRVLCGDSLDPEYVDLLMDGNKADIFITDPPYNVGYGSDPYISKRSKNVVEIENDNMSEEKFSNFLRSAFLNANNVMNPGAAFYIWHADSSSYDFRHACREVKWRVRQNLIWNKSKLVMGRQDYQWKHEPCLYGWKEGAAHYWGANRRQVTVLDCDTPRVNDKHPTMKPVELFETLIDNSSRPFSLLLDLFLGSGTAVIAAERKKRRCFGMELDPKYVDVTVLRWQDHTGKQAVLDRTGQKFNDLAKEKRTNASVA